MKDTVRTLLVEDDPASGATTITLLRASVCFDYRISEVTTLAAALAILRNTEVDLVILDLLLPDSGGVKTVQKIKELSRLAAVVVVSGSGNDFVERECMRAGASQFILKGCCEPSEIRRLVRNAVEFSRSDRAFDSVKKVTAVLEEIPLQCEHDPRLPPYNSIKESGSTEESVVTPTSETVRVK